MKIIHLITAARPNMMKIAPLWHAFNQSGFLKPVLVHTGQHYDANMSDIFLQQLGLPVPDVQFNVGGGSHNFQHAKVIEKYDALCEEQSPDLTLVVGDVNATASCALAAKKRLLPVAHMEAGLRSFDRTMPEEINRLVTDSIADIHW
ncbi:MAG: UDP-N-acetylglucosamine 2-epimerase (non-hydrolyzing), partial [Alphaproteobacteria bacterium]|nr:UDP-N-acetylglucosamine 2-epimerase (non-hydrolyzing) [Alphaproteobacteria bacterium]